MKYLSKFLRCLITLPNDLIFVPLVLLIHALWGQSLRLEGLCICSTLKENSSLFKSLLKYYNFYGMCLGHAMIYSPDAGEDTFVHEHVHEHQAEVAMFKSLVIGLIVLLITGKLWLSYVIWALGYLLYILSCSVIAGIRGENVYFGSSAEEHAVIIERAFLWNKPTATYYQQRYKKML